MSFRMMLALGLGLFATTIEAAEGRARTIDIVVTERGFEPRSIDTIAGEEVTLRVTRTTDVTCAKQILVPIKNLRLDLPLGKPVLVKLGKLKRGEVRFGCGMDMMQSAQIIIQ